MGWSRGVVGSGPGGVVRYRGRVVRRSDGTTRCARGVARRVRTVARRGPVSRVGTAGGHGHDVVRVQGPVVGWVCRRGRAHSMGGRCGTKGLGGHYRLGTDRPRGGCGSGGRLSPVGPGTGIRWD